jgi:hypothetical protein
MAGCAQAKACLSLAPRTGYGSAMADDFDTPSGGPPPNRPPSDKPAAKEEQRAEILMPGKNGYERAGYGGKTTFKKPTRKERRKAPTAVSPARQSEALAETVMSSILDRLTAEASRKGGMLSIDDLQALDQEFQKKTKALQQVFQASFDEYVKAREQSIWDKAREFPFGRMLVTQFSDTFAGKEGHSLKEGAVSRRILPGFFVAVNMMLGPEFVEGAQQLCRGIVDKKKAEKGTAFEWTDFYGDADAREVLMDGLMAIAPYFEAPDKRMAWMIDVINSHLEPADSEDMEGEHAEHWVLDEHGLRLVLDHLFKGLRDALANPASRGALSQRHGDDAVEEAVRILDILRGA